MTIPANVDPTPAILGICGRLAWRVVDEQWDQMFAPIFTNEPQVYVAAFKAFIIAKANSMPKDNAFGVFKSVLNSPKNSFWSKPETQKAEFDTAMGDVFRAYWSLAVKNDYWQPAKVRASNGWLTFADTVQTWSAQEASLIDDWKEELKTWRSDNN